MRRFTDSKQTGWVGFHCERLPLPRRVSFESRSHARSLQLSGWGCLGVLAAAGFEVHLLGEGGQEPGLPFGLAGEPRGDRVAISP